jgi:hypothetical protein
MRVKAQPRNASSRKDERPDAVNQHYAEDATPLAPARLDQDAGGGAGASPIKDETPTPPNQIHSKKGAPAV